MPPKQNKCEKGKQTCTRFIQYLARKSQENLALSAFMLEDDIGRKEIQQLDFKDRKLLFNPNKNVGVYVENMRKIIFPIVNEKRGMIFRCVLL